MNSTASSSTALRSRRCSSTRLSGRTARVAGCGAPRTPGTAAPGSPAPRPTLSTSGYFHQKRSTVWLKLRRVGDGDRRQGREDELPVQADVDPDERARATRTRPQSQRLERQPPVAEVDDHHRQEQHRRHLGGDGEREQRRRGPAPPARVQQEAADRERGGDHVDLPVVHVVDERIRGHRRAAAATPSTSSRRPGVTHDGHGDQQGEGAQGDRQPGAAGVVVGVVCARAP